MAIKDTHPGIDGRRFWSTVMRSGEIGPGKAGGLRRLALTDADKEMRDLFITWCTEAGCTVAVDRVGNIFARRPGDGRPPAARAHGQPPRHAVRGREIRRHRRRARRPRGPAHARRPAPPDQAPARAGVLDQRGRRALHAAHGGLGARSQASFAWTGSSASATTTASASAASSSASATTARLRWVAAASMPTSSCTSSKGPSSTRRPCPSGIVVGGYAYPRHARRRPRRDRARRTHARWTAAATRSSGRPCSRSP